jgi:hypothetical protein
VTTHISLFPKGVVKRDLGVGGRGVEADADEALVLAARDAHGLAHHRGLRERTALAALACDNKASTVVRAHAREGEKKERHQVAR